MELILKRIAKRKTYTIGHLYIRQHERQYLRQSQSYDFPVRI